MMEVKYTQKEIADQLLIKDAYREVDFRYALLNKYDIEIESKLDIIEGSVSLSALDLIKRTGTFTLSEYTEKNINFLSDRLQPYFRLRMPDGGWVEWPLGIFLMSSSRRKTGNAHVLRSINGYDKSIILNQDRFLSRYLIPKGANYVNAIVTIIGEAGLVKINIPQNGAVLTRDIEFEIGTTRLEAVNYLLEVINYTSIYADVNGAITAEPYRMPAERVIQHVYNSDSLSILEPEADEEFDLFDIPNVFVRVATNPENDEALKAVFINENPNSPLSTVGRGRSIVSYDEINDIADQDTLYNYTRRVAYESSQVYSKVGFSTAMMPTHGCFDILYLEHLYLRQSGKFIETNWKMELNAGSAMQHLARRIVYI